MALIQCTECGKEYSEHAKTCPNCGYSESNKMAKNAVKKTGSGIKKVGIILLLFALTAIIQGILIEGLGVQYPKGTHIFFSMGIAGLLALGAKYLGLFSNKED